MNFPSATYFESVCKQIVRMKAADFPKMVGHRLTLKERLGFMAVKIRARHYLKKGISKQEMDQLQSRLHPGAEKKTEGDQGQGQTALIIGIAAAALLVIGLVVPYIILGSLAASIAAIVIGSSAHKKNPSDGKASAGKLLGWITLGLIAILFLAIIVLLASWSWY